MRMALGSLRAINALLGHALAWRRRKTVNLCEHCDPWVQVSGNSSEALARVEAMPKGKDYATAKKGGKKKVDLDAYA